MGDEADALTEEMLSRSELDPDYDPDEQPSHRRRPKLGKSNMAKDKTMLRVAEVFEMEPGTEEKAAWVNPGMTGIVTAIKVMKSKKGQPMFLCTLKDADGSAEIHMTLFDHCATSKGEAIKEGFVLEIFGKGLRRTEYKDLQQISLGRDTEIHKVGESAHYKPSATAGAAGGERATSGGAPAGERAASTEIYGGTVGMAMKEAMALHTRGLDGEHLNNALCSPLFWGAVHETASDVIRLSIALERGKLAPSVKERNRSPEEKEADEKAKIEAEQKAAAEKAEKERKEKEAAEAAKKKASTADDSGDVPY